MPLAAFDLEIATELPDDDRDWWRHGPLGISCAGLMREGVDADPVIMFDPVGSPRLFDQATKRLTREGASMLVEALSDAARAGFTIVTWNGLGFDFRLLALETGLVARCSELAWHSVDMMFQVVCVNGYMLALDKALAGMGLQSKIHAVRMNDGREAPISGRDAPRLWQAGEYRAVMEDLCRRRASDAGACARVREPGPPGLDEPARQAGQYEPPGRMADRSGVPGASRARHELDARPRDEEALHLVARASVRWSRMTDLLLVRHGQSVSNAGLRTVRPHLTELTAVGEAQARLTAAALPEPRLIAVSPYHRARATAQPFIERWPAVSRVEWPVQEFTFLDPSAWDDTTASDCRPAVEAYWERAEPVRGRQRRRGVVRATARTHRPRSPPVRGLRPGACRRLHARDLLEGLHLALPRPGGGADRGGHGALARLRKAVCLPELRNREGPAGERRRDVRAGRHLASAAGSQIRLIAAAIAAPGRARLSVGSESRQAGCSRSRLPPGARETAASSRTRDRTAAGAR